MKRTMDNKTKPLVIPASAHNGHIVTHIVEGPPKIEKPFHNDLAWYFLKFSFFLLFLACLADYYQW